MDNNYKDYMHEQFMKHVKDRTEVVKAMHLIMQSMNNEDAYFSWIYTMPDCPDAEDFEFFASDEKEFDDLCDVFFKICRIYGKDGLYV